MLINIRPGTAGSYPSFLTVFPSRYGGSYLVFAATDGYLVSGIHDSEGSPSPNPNPNPNFNPNPTPCPNLYPRPNFHPNLNPNPNPISYIINLYHNPHPSPISSSNSNPNPNLRSRRQSALGFRWDLIRH
jgi:hypothetical protein